MYLSTLEKYIPKNLDINNFSIGAVYPRTTSPYGFIKYGNVFKHNMNKNEMKGKDCFLDTPIALILYYNNEEIAVISGMLRQENEFVIHQMQTISEHVYNAIYGITKPSVTHPITHQIPRQDILFDCLSFIIESLGIKNIYIQPGDKNSWTQKMYEIEMWSREYDNIISKTQTNIPHLSKKIAHQIYDVFAQKKGYTKDKSGFWINKPNRKSSYSKKKVVSNTPSIS